MARDEALAYVEIHIEQGPVLEHGNQPLGVVTSIAGQYRTRVTVGGAVTHRQRPATASGVTFLNLEDETGMVNVVCSVGLWTRYRKLAHTASALLVRGKVQNAEGAVTVVADRLSHLDLRVGTRSRDWQ